METQTSGPMRSRLARAFSAAGLTVLLLGAALWVVWQGGISRAHAQAPDPLPPADVKIWDAVGFGLGVNPDQSTADPLGVTTHVATAAAPLTITTVYENTICPGGPCGITFWNPVTNVFKCFGVTFGFQAAVDVNRSAPVKTSTSPSVATFQPGDAWASGPTGIPIYVNLKGSSNFRGYPVGSPWGIQVDQSTGNILFTENSTGTINTLDPATNARTAWAVGDTSFGLRYITRDTLGRIYATSIGLQQIIRVDPGAATSNVTRWAVPGGGLGFGGPTPDGITRDADGKIWFTESASDQIGRLSAGPDMILGTADDQICQYTKPGLSNPQLIATSGSDAPLVFSSKLLQAFFTENAGDAVSLLTQREASGGASGFETCTTVAPTVSTVTPTTSTVAAFDFTKPFIMVTIPPTTVTVPGFDGGPDAFGMTFTAGPDGIPGTADDERIPGILRWPLAVTGNSGPSGMTDVDLPNTVHGSFFSSSRLFEVKSRAIIAPASCGNICPLTQGFWKNHASVWPVTSLTLGSQTYTQAELLTILQTPVKGDASLILAYQLIAAKLNIANNACGTSIAATIASADSVLSGFAGKLPYKVAPSSSTGQTMVGLADTLDSFNNKMLAPSASGCVAPF